MRIDSLDRMRQALFDRIKAEPIPRQILWFPHVFEGIISCIFIYAFVGGVSADNECELLLVGCKRFAYKCVIAILHVHNIDSRFVKIYSVKRQNLHYLYEI